jgi:hypothetical protein
MEKKMKEKRWLRKCCNEGRGLRSKYYGEGNEREEGRRGIGKSKKVGRVEVNNWKGEGNIVDGGRSNGSRGKGNDKRGRKGERGGGGG